MVLSRRLPFPPERPQRAFERVEYRGKLKVCQAKNRERSCPQEFTVQTIISRDGYLPACCSADIETAGFESEDIKTCRHRPVQSRWFEEIVSVCHFLVFVPDFFLAAPFLIMRFPPGDSGRPRGPSARVRPPPGPRQVLHRDGPLDIAIRRRKV